MSDLDMNKDDQINDLAAQLAVAVGALEKLSRRHEGWEKAIRQWGKQTTSTAIALGPCVCEAHVEARKIIAASLPERAKALREVVEAAVIAREAPDFGHAHALNTLWEKVDALAKLEDMP